jgi:hypothetical protein
MAGKDKCEFLKGIRKRMAEANGIPYEPRECTFEGDCIGTCPYCEKEAAEILSKLKEKGENIIKTDTETIATFEENKKMSDDYEVYAGSLVNDDVIDETVASEIERRMKEQERTLMGDIDEKSYFDPKEEELIREEKRRLNFYNRKIKPFLESLFGSPLRGEVEF